MDRIKTILTIAAVAGMLSVSSANAQAPVAATISDSGTVTTSGPRATGRFGYFNIGNGQVRQQLYISPTEWRTYKHHAHIVYQRNEAWPKPFQCHDRQLYFANFYPMYQRGYEIESTLTDNHFDRETNKLNSAGKRKIAGIMQNMPKHRRNIYVFEKGDAEITQARVADVRVSVDEWFGHLGAPKIATTTNPVYYQSGVEVQQFTSNFLGALPTPGIAIGGGGGEGGGEGGN